jgi:hypothetical protein
MGFVYLFFFQIQAIWPFTIDDMYISLRYAKHWSEGFGLVWNINQAPVEGYSNFSFVVLGSIAISLGLNPVVILKSIGAIGLLLTSVAIFQLTRFWYPVRYALIPCLWLLAYKGQILWSVSGLETTIFQALIAFSLVYLFKGAGYHFYPQAHGHAKNTDSIIAGILLATASLTRPEGPAFAILFVFLIAFSQPSKKVYVKNQSWFIALISFCICFLPYFIWHYCFYGRLFPNPVYCKGVSGLMNFALDKQYLKLIWPFAILSFPAICFSKDRRHLFLWLPSVLYLVLLVDASSEVAFDNRLFLPAFALILPLTWQGINILLSGILVKHPKMKMQILYFAGIIMFFFIPMMSLSNYRYYTINPIAGEQLRENVLRWLDRNASNESKIVLADSGLIPYQSSLEFIDSYCLNNKEMTLKSDEYRYSRFCRQTMYSKPDVIILTALIENGHVKYTPADECLAEKVKLSRDYRLQGLFSSGTMLNFYRYEIFQLNKPKS